MPGKPATLIKLINISVYPGWPAMKRWLTWPAMAATFPENCHEIHFFLTPFTAGVPQQ